LELLDELVCEGLELEVLLELLGELLVPLDELLFVFLDFFLVALDVGVVLQLAAKLASRLF